MRGMLEKQKLRGTPNERDQNDWLWVADEASRLALWLMKRSLTPCKVSEHLLLASTKRRRDVRASELCH